MQYIYSTLLLLWFLLIDCHIYGQTNSNQIERIEFLLEGSARLARTNQDSAIIFTDSALVIAKELNNRKYISNSYKSLGQVYRYANKQNQAREAYNTAIKYTNNDKEIAKIEHLIGHTFAAESEFKLAIQQYKVSNKYATEHKDTSLLASSALDIGVIYARKGAFHVAIEYFFNSIEYYEAVEETQHIIPLLNNIGSIYLDIKEYDKALIYLKKAEERVKLAAYEQKHYLVHVATNLGRCYNYLGEPEKAIENYRIALLEIEKSPDSSLKGTVYNQLGAIYLHTKELKQAEQFYKKAFRLLKGENYPAEFAAALRGLAKINQQYGKSKKALAYIEEASAINIKIDNLDDIVTDYQLLSSIHQDLGNTEKAFNYLQEYIELKDSVFNIDRSTEILLLESKYNYKQEELKLLSEVQNLKNDKILQQSRQTILILLLILISLILTALFWILSKNRKENSLLIADLENKKIIEEQSKELRSLNEILEIKVQERTNELQSANQNLEQANYELRTFNYIASHDIKEPIRVISGYAGLIFKQLSPELKENLADYFTTIKRSTKQLYTLIEDFARYTTLSKDEVVDQETVDLSYITFMVTDNIQESIQKYNGLIILHEFPMIKSNTSFLITILKNLIENGLKYNRSKNPKVDISYNSTGIYHQIIISDNGIGIDMTYHDKIFEVFKRLHNRAEYEGTGIGLAIVKLCVTKLKGKIALESNLEEGSKFIISLPKE